MRKYKVKKAVNGLQDVAVPQQGSYSNVLSSTSSLAASGSQFGPWGAAIGGGIGLAAGLLQKGQQDRASKLANYTNSNRKMNRAYTAEDEGVNQANQRFSKGTKMIEIEGKKTPEIHTDKNFNVKNLGTIPHSKGGNKVEAEEGDIVFNTQNSLSKYNRIANAISSGNKNVLKKEQSKLPTDSGTKNQTGNKGVKRDYMMEEQEREAQGLPKPSYMSKPKGLPTSPSAYNGYTNSDDYYKSYKGKEVTTNGITGKLANDGSGEVYYPNGRKKLPSGKMVQANGLPRSSVANLTSYGKAFQPIPNPITDSKNYVKTPDFTLGANGKGSDNTSPISSTINKKITAPVNIPRVGKQVYKPTKTPTIDTLTVNKLDNSNFTDIGDGSDLATPKQKMGLFDNIKYLNNGDSKPSKTTSQAKVDNTTTKSDRFNTGLNNALQFTGVANNLFQGLKGEEGIDQKYYTPDKLKYIDRSQSLRNQSNQAMNASISNARNLSGGNVGNLRANANAARIANLSAQGGIDEREQARADAINNQNTEISNQAAQVNLSRKDNYQNMMLQNRAAKQSYLDQAASDIGQYGMAKREESYMRNRDRLASEAQMAGYNSINGRYQHKSNLDGSTYFDADADSSITKYGTGGGNRVVTKKKSSNIFKNGTKSVKLKSVV